MGVRFVAVECGGVSLALPLILVVVVDVVVFFFGGGVDIGCSVCLSFFFLVAVADIGGRWLICGRGR